MKYTKPTYEDCIKELGFEVVESLPYPVFKISKNGSLFTFKPGWKPGSFNCKQVITENKALDRIGKVDGIVEKVSFHEFEEARIVALIRRYVEGEDLIDAGRKIVYPDVLVNAVNALHKNGIGIRDSGDNNIVLDPTGKPVIIDLGLCDFEGEVSKRRFVETKEISLRVLESILKRYT